MTRTVSAPHLRPVPRFTFAGRGCRDSRREPRRLPAAFQPRPTTVATAATGVTVAAPVAEVLSRADAQRRPGTGVTRPTTADHPPPDGTGGVRCTPAAHPPELAFVFRDTAEKERQLPGGAAGASG